MGKLANSNKSQRDVYKKAVFLQISMRLDEEVEKYRFSDESMASFYRTAATELIERRKKIFAVV